MSKTDIGTELADGSARDGASVPLPRTSTRTSRAWGLMSVGLAASVAVVMFALQNLDDVQVRFFGLHGELPLVVLLMVVAALGALVVFAVGASRIMQLRLRARRVARDLPDR